MGLGRVTLLLRGAPGHAESAAMAQASRDTSGNLHVPLTHSGGRKPLSFLRTDTDTSASLRGMNPKDGTHRQQPGNGMAAGALREGRMHSKYRPLRGYQPTCALMSADRRTPRSRCISHPSGTQENCTVRPVISKDKFQSNLPIWKPFPAGGRQTHTNSPSQQDSTATAKAKDVFTSYPREDSLRKLSALPF